MGLALGDKEMIEGMDKEDGKAHERHAHHSSG